METILYFLKEKKRKEKLPYIIDNKEESSRTKFLKLQRVYEHMENVFKCRILFSVPQWEPKTAKASQAPERGQFFQLITSRAASPGVGGSQL